MFIKSTFIIYTSILFFTGCSFKSPTQVISLKTTDDITIQSASLQHLIQEKRIKEESFSQSLDEKLNDFYSEWKGVRYKFGGNSKKGIDCSALIQIAFKDKLNVNIPRTTRLQSKTGYEIRKNELNTGDLVFFKTGKNSRHVGIYLKNGEFIHASSKRGVTISKLDNVYFKKHYWKSQRILD